MGQALANTMRAVSDGVTWVDATVTGMGRGPGNAKTEYVAIELAPFRKASPRLAQLMKVVNKHFKPMQDICGWGSNTFYYLAGKYGIHPTYIQEMLSDSRYSEEDILAVIEHLKNNGGKKFSQSNMEAGRQFGVTSSAGTWRPSQILAGKRVLVLGSGPSVLRHKKEIESYIRSNKLIVIALNANQSIDSEFTDMRAACHPIRLAADIGRLLKMSQPIIMPLQVVDDHIKQTLSAHELLDFGLSIEKFKFVFGEKECVIPQALVIAYVLAIAASGNAQEILLAGLDGYGAGDPRTLEMDQLLSIYKGTPGSPPIVAITPTAYDVIQTSVYALNS